MANSGIPKWLPVQMWSVVEHRLRRHKPTPVGALAAAASVSPDTAMMLLQIVAAKLGAHVVLVSTKPLPQGVDAGALVVHGITWPATDP